MSVIHSFLPMRRRVLHIAYVTSTLNCQWGEGGILHISHPMKVTSFGGGWVGSSTFHIQTVTSIGVGILHISHPDKVTSMGEGPPHCTCNFNSQLPMGVLSSTFHILTKVTSMWGRNPPHFTSKVTSSGRGCGWVVSSIFHIQSKSNCGGWMAVSSTSHIQSKSHRLQGWRWGYPPHLINQVECASAVQAN